MDEQQHNKTKKKLRLIGAILVIIGIAFVVTGFIDFSLCFVSTTVPTLFFLIFIGAPMIFVGIALLGLGFKKEITTYVKNEAVPVINEAADDLKPAVKSGVGAVKESINDDPHTITCPRCGERNPAGHKFCAECGGSLVKTCPVCGAKQEADDKFCGECGAKFE